MPAALAHLPGHSAAQNVETACRFGRAQITEWAHPARVRGNLQPVRDDRIKANRERPAQCANDQLAEFAGRDKAKDCFSGPSNRSRYQAQKRSQFSHPSSYRIEPKRRAYGRDTAPHKEQGKKEMRRRTNSSPLRPIELK